MYFCSCNATHLLLPTPIHFFPLNFLKNKSSYIYIHDIYFVNSHIFSYYGSFILLSLIFIFIVHHSSILFPFAIKIQQWGALNKTTRLLACLTTSFFSQNLYRIVLSFQMNTARKIDTFLKKLCSLWTDWLLG